MYKVIGGNIRKQVLSPCVQSKSSQSPLEISSSTELLEREHKFAATGFTSLLGNPESMTAKPIVGRTAKTPPHGKCRRPCAI